MSYRAGIFFFENIFVKMLDKFKKVFEYLSITFNKRLNDMKSLTEILFTETASLKSQYLELTREWAVEQVTRNHKRLATYNGIRSKEHAIEVYRYLDTYYKEQKWKYSVPGWHFSETEYPQRMVKAAEEHYEDSIKKLAYRIESKGLNQELLTVKTAHVGVNIDTVITDGTKTVRAFTIIASGPIQRPHYRYLIK